MPKSETATLVELAALGGQFLDIMKDYQERQNDDPNFEPRTQIYDLYEDLDYLCNQTNSNLSKQ